MTNRKSYAQRYYARHKAKWHQYTRHNERRRRQTARASRRYYRRTKRSAARQRKPATSAAKRRANAKWSAKHHDRQLRYVRRSKCKHYILHSATPSDLPRIELDCQHARKMIEYRHVKEVSANENARPSR